MTRHLFYLSVPGLRPTDVRPDLAPTLHDWARSGVLASLVPSFPCVTSPVQASTWTGVPPQEHGVIANGFYDRDRRAVEFWVGRNGVIQGRQIWEDLRQAGLTSAVWHAQNIKDAAATFIVTPEPIHHADGRTELWCYSQPTDLYRRLVDDLGHFPLQHYWGPLANIQSSKWILAGAQWLQHRHEVNFHYIYLPHLDYAAQKFGPDSPQAAESVRELDALLANFRDAVQASDRTRDAVFLVASEYAITGVTGVVYPNVLLRGHGLLQTISTTDGEVIDFAAGTAFAMVDHQLAHVYVSPSRADEVASLFAGVPGVRAAYAGTERQAVGLAHPRAGEVILVAEQDHWFAYYWWTGDADAPGFARTVDIHRKPGYDPVELFFDPRTRSIPLNAGLVKGSHGAPVTDASRHGALLCSSPFDPPAAGRAYRDVDLRGLCLRLLGVPGLADR